MPLLRQAALALCVVTMVAALSCGSDNDSGPNHVPALSGGSGGAAAGEVGTAGTLGGGAPPVGGNAGGAGMPDARAGAGAEGGVGGAGAVECPECSPPSCRGAGGPFCRGIDCCASIIVPGGTFDQGEPDAFSSSVAEFRLDAYEVTVGRFRRFAAEYDGWIAAGNPVIGAGENPNVPTSGWRAEWTASLPADRAALESAVTCTGRPTWTRADNDDLPINCVDWYTAFAFCVWDEGRLPTDAEAEYAAAGGERDLLYPWGATPVLTDMQDSSADYAVYLCLADASDSGQCTAGDLPAVGSRTKGRGYYQHYDQVGSVWEWALDWWQEKYPTTAQTNYAKLDAGPFRVTRGGSWDNTAKLVSAASRTGMMPVTRIDTVGVRCARNPSADD
jgi:formylglycine-generating enzyme